ncbi:MAG TPA: cell division protein FtsK [Cryomorphaceae bacterium]|jgi:DNA segregation ATPase FtsK/SpoIIIE, S-DNA-T family|nr:MAG: cell division protein FtsK [Cryomorphaceae bacterium BACL7 MAG-120910-bin2]KRO68967.1 MAG: cell division protein FtsK [Cryomorphaceae bacterium BACL7 MAG-120322-bin74]KRO83717.1 MAG: cell division protein FtsK [Cryomorphaceae bacterium BACL7 MAG-121220-bin83]HAB31143.1 cell division protein FtsK [Cryomorphaceae bacterium]HAG48544.1 cell division protein FtsK [Cryomorphaceae bacterium]
MAKKAKASTSSAFLTGLRAFWQDLQTNKSLHAVFGILLLFLAGFSLFASVSSLYAWRADYSAFEGSFSDILFDPNVNIQNAFGKLGAGIGFLLTVKSFGWTFVLPLGWFILLGAKWGLGFSFKAATWFRRILLWTFMLSILTGMLPWILSDAWVGNLGHALHFWAVTLLGTTGTWLAWISLAAIHAVWLFKMAPQTWRKEKDLLLEQDETYREDAEEDSIDGLEENMGLEAPEDGQADFLDEIPSPTPLPIENIAESRIFPNGPDLEIEVMEPVEVHAEALMEEDAPIKKGAIGSLFNPRDDLSKYQFPTLDLLADFPSTDAKVDAEELEANKERIIETLRNYKIEISKIKAAVGPTVTLYEIVPEAGVRISKIKSLEDDIALSLSALGIRIIAPIPGRGTIGIEVPNRNPQMVSMKTVLASERFQKTTMDLPIALGMTISNEVFVADLAKMPHLLMAGATGQGKSVGLNALLASILYKKHPSEVKFVLVDPKKVELTLYNKIERHFLAKLPDSGEAIITDTTKVIHTLNSLCIEMDDRYDLLKDAMVRNIKEYNQKFTNRKLNPEEGHRYLPYIILVIDEFADLIMTAGKEVETPIARLAQLARAIGIHLIIATQRPSVNVITGIIKANFPARIAFKVSAKIDSRTILDAGGAEQLIGKGDMLFSAGNDLIRLQCAFLDTPEVEEVCEFIGSQQAYPDAYALPEYSGEEGNASGGSTYSAEERDALFIEAARIVVMQQQGSASLLQRKLKLGYNRAGRLIDQLEDAGILGPFEGSKARQVLVQDEHHLMERLNGN